MILHYFCRGLSGQKKHEWKIITTILFGNIDPKTNRKIKNYSIHNNIRIIILLAVRRTVMSVKRTNIIIKISLARGLYSFNPYKMANKVVKK